MSTLVILFANLGTYFLELLPCAVAQRLKLSLRMLGCNVLDYVLARLAAVVVWRACQLVLDNAVEAEGRLVSQEEILAAMKADVVKLKADDSWCGFFVEMNDDGEVINTQ